MRLRDSRAIALLVLAAACGRSEKSQQGEPVGGSGTSGGSGGGVGIGATPSRDGGSGGRVGSGGAGVLTPQAGASSQIEAGQGGEASEPVVSCDDPLEFQDAVLEGAVREALDLESGPIAAEAAAELTSLPAMQLVGSLSGIECLTGLTQLEIEGGLLDDLAPLAGLTQLESVQLAFCSVHDLTPLAGLSRLRTLDLTSNFIADLTPLAGLEQLESLLVDYNEVSVVSPLAELPELTTLGLSYNRITAQTAFAGFLALETLTLKANDLARLPDLGSMTALQTLLAPDNSIDVINLSDHLPLKTLDLWDNRLLDLSGLAVLSSLEDLSLATSIALSAGQHIEVIGSLDTLKVLRLRYVDATDLSFLDGLPLLTELSILLSESEYGFDSASISAATQLTALNLTGCGIESLDFITPLTNLSLVNLTSNKISNLTPLVQNAGLAGGDTVKLKYNLLSCATQAASLATLQQRGVVLTSDCD